MKNTQLHHRPEAAGPHHGIGRGVSLTIALLAVLLGAGCQTVHEVTVDAISSSHKQTGQSYRLEVIDPSGGVETEVQAEAIAMARDALGARGLYEAPAGAKPDVIINYEYGVGQGHIQIVTERNVDMLLGPFVTQETSSKAVVVYEKFIELTAREAVTTPDPAHPGAPAKPGEELWNIRSSIVDAQKDLAPYLPALATACIDYIGENTGKELHIKVETNAAKEILKHRRRPSEPAK